jgi:hypothetical protein
MYIYIHSLSLSLSLSLTHTHTYANTRAHTHEQEAAAFKLLEAFHKSGIVFHFGTSSSAQLKDTVFIKPQVP